MQDIVWGRYRDLVTWTEATTPTTKDRSSTVLVRKDESKFQSCEDIFDAGGTELGKKGDDVLLPDDEASDVTSGCQLQQVKPVHADGVHPRDVPKGPGQSLVLVVDHQGAQFLDPPPVPHLALSGAHALGLVDLLHVGPGLEAAQEDHRLLSLGVALDLVGHHQGNLGDLVDPVACQGRKNRTITV